MFTLANQSRSDNVDKKNAAFLIKCLNYFAQHGPKAVCIGLYNYSFSSVLYSLEILGQGTQLRITFRYTVLNPTTLHKVCQSKYQINRSLGHMVRHFSLVGVANCFDIFARRSTVKWFSGHLSGKKIQVQEQEDTGSIPALYKCV